MDNCAFGTYTLYNNTTGGSNVAYGQDGQRYGETGSYNVSIGVQSLYNNVVGSYNTVVGTYAARGTANPPDEGAGTGPSPTYLCAFGVNAAHNAAGTYNHAFGASALYSVTGSYNVAVGGEAGAAITSGASNVFIGHGSGNASQSASVSNTVAIGAASKTTGDAAVSVGVSSSAAVSAVAVGQSASASAAGGIAIGAASSAVGANSIAIGQNVTALAANQIIIGNSSNTGTYLYGGLQPQLDNTQPIGGAAGRWSVVYAGTGVINTSDEREKQDIATLEPAELRVAAALKLLVKKFRFKNAAQAKGDAARIHVGVLAQEVMAAFQSEGLDPMRYGIVCYDEWDAEGDEPAGNRYGVRYEELLAFIISAL